MSSPIFILSGGFYERSINTGMLDNACRLILERFLDEASKSLGVFEVQAHKVLDSCVFTYIAPSSKPMLVFSVKAEWAANSTYNKHVNDLNDFVNLLKPKYTTASFRIIVGISDSEGRNVNKICESSSFDGFFQNGWQFKNDALSAIDACARMYCAR